jgi:hypothetical protein
MYSSFADMIRAHKADAETVREETPVQPPVVLELSVTDAEGRQCCPNCRTPFMGLGPTCYSC